MIRLALAETFGVCFGCLGKSSSVVSCYALLLAKTCIHIVEVVFLIFCRCSVLDEPTVNLDYHNKQGLATALAQIIATRSKQSNFQLVLITHDEDFVTMMKGELSTHSGFSLPEKYFQVRREEGMDGKYYSKIDPIDWDELLVSERD